MKDSAIRAQAGTATPPGAVRQAIRLRKLLDDFLVTASRGELRVEITSKDIVRELKRIARIGRVFTIAILAMGLVRQRFSSVSIISGMKVSGQQREPACWSCGRSSR